MSQSNRVASKPLKVIALVSTLLGRLGKGYPCPPSSLGFVANYRGKELDKAGNDFLTLLH